MWANISRFVTEAVDTNMATIAAINQAQEHTKPVAFIGKTLARNDLRFLRLKAEDLDTKLRAFLLTIQEEVKIEQEAAP